MHHRRHVFDLVSVALAQLLEQGEIAGALRSETKVLADQKPARPEPFREHLLDESFRRERRERAAETLNVHALHPVRREQLEFFAQRGQARGRRLRREELARMRLEREHAARQAALACPGAEALQHRLVSAMDAVEIADGQRNRRQHRIGTAVGKQHEAPGINAKF